MRHLTWLLSLVCLLFALAPSALAQGAPSTSAKREAKAAFAAGQKAFDKKDYAEALQHFRKAFNLHGHDAVRFNIAVCLEKLGRVREAMIEYETAAKSDQLDDAARARASAQAADMRKQLGKLVVEGTPSGAEVLVDGEQLCNIPCSVDLDPARHDVTVQSGDKNEKRSVEIVKQETRTIRVKLDDASAPATPAAPAEPAVTPERDEPRPEARGGGPGWLTWTGIGLTAIGGAGIVVFGTRAKSKHDDWVETGDPSAKDDGVMARNLTNASIGVAVLGAVAIGVDLLFLAPNRRPSKETATAPRGLRFEF